MSAAEGGSITDVLKAVAFSFISKAVWGAVGAIENVGKVGMALIHGVVNGALTVAQGGNFLVGFATGVIGKATSFISDAVSKGNMLLDTFIVAAAGCASSVIAGGKCANGAISAAFANMYNKWRAIGIFKEKIAELEKQSENFRNAMEILRKDNINWNAIAMDIYYHRYSNGMTLPVTALINHTTGDIRLSIKMILAKGTRATDGKIYRNTLIRVIAHEVGHAVFASMNQELKRTDKKLFSQASDTFSVLFENSVMQDVNPNSHIRKGHGAGYYCSRVKCC